MLALAGLAALILGFLAKRIMIPSALHYIAYRPPERAQSRSEPNPPASSIEQGAASDAGSAKAKSNGDADAGGEQLTPSDRGELDAIIKRSGK